MKFINQLRALFQKEKIEADMAEEMRLHVELQAGLNRKAGMSAEEALLAAQRQFGNVGVIQQQAREARPWIWLEQFGKDFRYAARMLGKTPGFTITAIATLALGIGVNAALFAVYDILALRPLPSRAPDEIVDIKGRNDKARGGGIDARFSYPDYLDYCAGTEAFTDLIAVNEIGVRLPEVTPPVKDATPDSMDDIVTLQTVSGNYFSALGGELAMGRDFLPHEAGVHVGKPVLILSHQFWQKQLAGDPNVLGRVIQVQHRRATERTAYTVIGVAAPDFVGQSPLTPAGWIPLTAAPLNLTDRTTPLLSVTGRMRAGISQIQAKADLDVIAQRLVVAYPAERRAISVELLPGMRILNLGMDARLAMALSPVLLGFVLVLVVSCLNVANLLLARGVARQHEIGVRLVLGAGRGRLVRQLFAENLLLCGMGAGAALVIALWTLRAFKPVMVSMLATEPKAQAFVSMINIGLDGRIVGFGALLAVVAGLTAGLAPALHAVRRDGVFALKNEGTAFGRGMTQSRLRGFLLVGQVAVCLTLLAVCGMMSGKLLRIRANGTGFVTDNVYLATPAARSGAATELSRDPLGAIETLRTLSGVESACLVESMPLGKPGGNVRGVAIKAGEEKTRISYNRVSAGFFDSFGVPVVRGRAFTPQETSGGAPVVIVSESAAKRLWPGEEALGKVLAVDDVLFVQRSATDVAEQVQGFHECAVIGVSRDFLSNWGGTQDKDIMLLPVPVTGAAGTILMRLQSDSLAVRQAVEATALAGGLPIKLQDTLAEVVDRGLWPYRAFASISGALTGLTLLLATVGLYGVVSFGVNQRTREIGVRMALGATAERVTGFFVRQGMRLVAYGIGFGLVGGTAFGVLLSKVMPGADFAGPVPFRCLVFAVVTILLSVIALVACWLPARRAAKVDPMVALRAE